jgi:hypothetical protein
VRFVIERLTYVCGLAVAVIGWAIGLLVSDLTNVPVLYSDKSTETLNGAPSALAADQEQTCEERLAPITGAGAPVADPNAPAAQLSRFEFKNLSRKGRIGNLTIKLLSSPSCVLQVHVSGPEWTRSDKMKACDVTLKSLMPGGSLSVDVAHRATCPVQYKLVFNETNAVVRTIDSGLEGFLLQNWLHLIVGLLAVAALVFVIALVKAYRASMPPAPVPPPPPEGEVVPPKEYIA